MEIAGILASAATRIATSLAILGFLGTSTASTELSAVGSVSGAARRPVWVAVEGGRRIAKVDATGKRVLRRIRVPASPHNITVAADGTVVATMQRSGRIVMIGSGRRRTIALGGSPHDVKVAGRTAMITNEGASRLDRVRLDGRVRRPIRLRTDPHDLAVAPNARTAWVSMDGTGALAVVDLERGRVRRYISTGRRPHDLLFSPDGRRVWVTDWNGSVTIFSRRGRPLRTIRKGRELHHLAFTPNGRWVWLADNGGRRVFVASSRRMRVVASRRVGGAPHHLAVTPDGDRVVVADNTRRRVVVFNARTRRRLGTVRVGAGPHGVWAVP